MPTELEVRSASALFSESFELPSEVRVLRRLARTFPWALAVLIGSEGLGGYCFFRVLPGRKAILLSMAVDRRYRRRGYGRSMLSFALEVLRETGIAEVLLDVGRDNAAAIGLYHSLGFSAVPERRERESIRMKKDLPVHH